MAVQQGRSESRPEGVHSGDVEDLNDARTTLADFFSILPKSRRSRRESPHFFECLLRDLDITHGLFPLHWERVPCSYL
jgi:hypothetical protein